MPAPKLTHLQLEQLEELTKQYSDNEIAVMWDCRHGTVRYQRIKRGIPSYTERTGHMKDKSTGISRRRGTHNQYNSDSLNEDYFSVIDTPEKAYWIGFLATDGCISEGSRIQLGLDYKDKDCIDMFAKTLGISHFVKEKVIRHESFLGKSKTCHSYALRFSSQKMAADLAKELIVPRKTKTLLMSPCAELFPTGYLRGYIDGDGTIGKINFKLCSASEVVIDQIRDLVKRHTGHLLYKCYQVSKTSGGYVWLLQGVRKDQPVLKWLYEDLINIPYMERKLIRFSRYWENYQVKTKYSGARGALLSGLDSVP